MAPLPLRRSRGQRSGNCLRSRVTWSSAISVLIRSLTRRAVTIKLFDLAGAEPDRRFSPYCWRTKLALAHKGLTVETIPWLFSETHAIEMSGQGRVPVLLDGDKGVSASWTSAEYLEDTYQHRAFLFGSAKARALHASSIPGPTRSSTVLSSACC